MKEGKKTKQKFDLLIYRWQRISSISTKENGTREMFSKIFCLKVQLISNCSISIYCFPLTENMFRKSVSTWRLLNEGSQERRYYAENNHLAAYWLFFLNFFLLFSLSAPMRKKSSFDRFQKSSDISRRSGKAERCVRLRLAISDKRRNCIHAVYTHREMRWARNRSKRRRRRSGAR